MLYHVQRDERCRPVSLNRKQITENLCRNVCQGYLSAVFEQLKGLEDVDALVLELACKEKIASGNDTSIADVVFESSQPLGISRVAFDESLEILNRNHFIKSLDGIGRKVGYFRIGEFYFDQFLHKHLNTYDDVVRQIGLAILNQELCGTQEIANSVGQPHVVVNHLLDEMGRRRLFKVHRTGKDRLVSQVSPELKRAVTKDL